MEEKVELAVSEYPHTIIKIWTRNSSLEVNQCRFWVTCFLKNALLLFCPSQPIKKAVWQFCTLSINRSFTSDFNRRFLFLIDGWHKQNETWTHTTSQIKKPFVTLILEGAFRDSASCVSCSSAEPPALSTLPGWIKVKGNRAGWMQRGASADTERSRDFQGYEQIFCFITASAAETAKLDLKPQTFYESTKSVSISRSVEELRVSVSAWRHGSSEKPTSSHQPQNHTWLLFTGKL